MNRTRARGVIPVALLAAFAAGALVDGWLRTHGPPRPVQNEEVRVTPAATEQVPAISAPPASPPSSAISAVSPTAGTTGDVPHTGLRPPIDGMDVESLKGGFDERRGDGSHEAVDILAPRDTPVHAVEDGSVAKLFTSKAGGLTIYQFDPAGRLCYYYAHLSRYADGLADGQTVSKGQVIGYVGTTGNAPPNTPHLHFAVFELNADRHWWQGRALDPYRVFKDRS